jgi:hypothetical protein
MAKKTMEAERLNVRLPYMLHAYLGDLSDLGLHGDTRSDVVRTLLALEVERLIKEGFLKLRSPGSGGGANVG